jgi:hypothetical protein
MKLDNEEMAHGEGSKVPAHDNPESIKLHVTSPPAVPKVEFPHLVPDISPA